MNSFIESAYLLAYEKTNESLCNIPNKMMLRGRNHMKKYENSYDFSSLIYILFVGTLLISFRYHRNHLVKIKQEERGMRKILVYVLVSAVLLLSLASGCGSETTDSTQTKDGVQKNKLKVALCLVSPVNDGAWSTIAYEAVKEAQKKYDFDFVYTENLKPTEMEAVFTDYASQGVDLIIGHSFSFGDAALAVGERFPDVSIAIIDGVVEAENVASYNLATQETGYLMGVFSALMTKTGKIGAVEGVEGPSIIKVAEGFKIGARSINPDIEIMVAYTGSFDDAARSKEAAQSMIDQGADVIMAGANQSNAGCIKACEEAGIICMGEMEQQSLAPKTVAFCGGTDAGKLVEATIEEVIEGKFEGGIRDYGFASDALFLTDYGEMDDQIPDDVKAKIADILAQLKAGELTVPKIEQITND